MNNPFSNLKFSKDNDKAVLEKEISNKAWEISGKIISAKVTSKDVDELELLYTKFFKKYPDTIKQLNAKKRINQLKTMVN